MAVRLDPARGDSVSNSRLAGNPQVIPHSPAPRGAGDRGVHPLIASRALEKKAPAPEEPALIRIADEAIRVQQEDWYLRPVLDPGYQFLFTFDEDGYPIDDDVVTEWQFGFGAAHFYGRLDATGQAVEIAGGLIENS